MGTYDRRKFLGVGAGMGIGALLAACGGSDDDGGDTGGAAAGGQSSAAVDATNVEVTVDTAAGPKFDPATEPDQPIQVYEWAGYEVPEMWEDYVKGEYNAKSPLKFQFLSNDQQALAKVASGFNPDLIHPCIAYTVDYQQAGLIQPLDLSMLPDFEGIPEDVRKGGVINGEVYAYPFDLGFSALVYRADKMPLQEESWEVLLDDKYKGKMALFSDDVSIIKIGALINEGAIDPNVLTSEQIQASKETMLKVKPNLRTFWDSQTDTINDFVNGNLWATYVWPDGYYKIKNHPKMKDVEVKYMWPTQGRLAWVCALVLNSKTKVPGRAHLAIAAAGTPKVAAWLTDAYQYGAAQQEGVQELIKNKELIKEFSLDDPSAFQPPRAWFEAPLPNRKEYVDAAQTVKAS